MKLELGCGRGQGLRFAQDPPVDPTCNPPVDTFYKGGGLQGLKEKVTSYLFEAMQSGEIIEACLPDEEVEGYDGPWVP